MSFHGIVTYLSRALSLALPATALAYFLRRRRLHRCGVTPQKKREGLVLLFFLYFFSLIAITAIRDGRHLADFWRLPHDFSTVQLVPITVTLKQGRAGAWYLIYPIAGNILWFFPFGFLLRHLRPQTKLRQAALWSLLLSCAIEVSQWVLLSGISDIDDVIFNLIGGVLGWAAALAVDKCKEK